MSKMSRLRSIPDLDLVVEASRQRPVFIFKHSLTCPVSTAAFDEYQRYVEAAGDESEALFALIEIQNARDVSQALTERSKVRHESPQALLFVDEKVVWHASHWSIRIDSLGQALADLQEE